MEIPRTNFFSNFVCRVGVAALDYLVFRGGESRCRLIDLAVSGLCKIRLRVCDTLHIQHEHVIGERI